MTTMQQIKFDNLKSILPAWVDIDVENIDLIAEIQKIYSSLYLDGKIEDQLFVSAAVTSTLMLFGVTPLITDVLSTDMHSMKDVQIALQKLKERLNDGESERESENPSMA